MSETNITEEHKKAFEAIRNADNIALVSCFVNGELAVAICEVRKVDGGFAVMPMFVSVTPSMKLVDHDGTPC
jgi:hypothetical protein